MKWTRSVAALSLTYLGTVLAQSWNEQIADALRILPGFPEVCAPGCEAFNSASLTCFAHANTRSEVAVHDCLCDGTFPTLLDQCGACVAEHVDVARSESYTVLVKIAAAFSIRCSQPVQFAGDSPQFTSALEALKTQQHSASTASVPTDGTPTTGALNATISSPTAGTASTSEKRPQMTPSGAGAGSSGAAEIVGTVGGWALKAAAFVIFAVI